jgi:DNA segregation ATPase FtsK/SpoIIIE, S-DNA-T family
MAAKTKIKKDKTPEPAEMSPETEEKVQVSELLKDERTHKIVGVILLLISFSLFIGFTSYLFTWQADESKVWNQGWKILLPSHAQPMDNLLGTAGAYFSHLIFRFGFGVASYLFCSVFFVAGVNLFFGRKIFSVLRNVKYLIVGLLVISATASFLLRKPVNTNVEFPWGGAVGDFSSAWLEQVMGSVGTAAVLFVTAFSYIIWRFNPVFRLPSRKKVMEQMDIAPVENVESPVEENVATDEATVFAGNAGTVQQMLNIIPEKEINDHGLELIEKELEDNKEELPMQNVISELSEAPVAVPPPPPQPPPPVVEEIPESDLQLEIKTVPEAVAEEITPAAVKVQKPYDPILDLRDYKYPTLDLLDTHGSEKIVQDPNELETNKNQIINTLRNYDIEIQKIFATVGPTVTLYEIIPAAGVRISRIKNLEDDIALSLAALGIRIIAPIPGKGTIGIEVPNLRKSIVSMKTLLSSEKFQNNHFSLPIAIGKKIDNENFIVDLASMPHLLMAGATGQGKSVGLNAILVSLLYKKHPSQLKFVLVDPKKVELSIYKSIEKHFLAKLPGEEDAIITDTKKVIHTLNALCIEMDNRYDLLKEAGTRNIKEYNEKFVARKLNPEKGHQFLPFIVLVVDEFADLIMTAGKEVEMPIARLAQLARAVGIHLIIATQRPSVNIITGTIKANFPARIAFKVSSKIDSRTILDIGGAEQLIGKGDMLISYNGELVRLQCAFVDTPEVDKIVDFISEQRGYPQAFLLPEYVDEKELEAKGFDGEKDPLFEDAARLIVMSQMGSTSLLQRKMKLGYNRAGRLMDQLEAAGVVGGNQGSKARDVLFKTESELQQYLDQM